jgi:hypothetical protein
MSVRSMSLEETTAEAGRIVQGKVVEVRAGTDDSGLPATWITFQTTRTLKGTRKAQVTVKQFGNADATSGKLLGYVPDLPRYTVGEEVVVFLRPESARGFTSPVGLEEGVYRIGVDGGRRVARNSRANEGGDVDAFLARVEKLVARQQAR